MSTWVALGVDMAGGGNARDMALKAMAAPLVLLAPRTLICVL